MQNDARRCKAMQDDARLCKIKYSVQSPRICYAIQDWKDKIIKKRGFFGWFEQKRLPRFAQILEADHNYKSGWFMVKYI